MAVPKRKTSKARRDSRRSSHWKLDLPTLVTCPECHQQKLAHRVCKHCGFYDGRKAVDMQKKDKKADA